AKDFYRERLRRSSQRLAAAYRHYGRDGLFDPDDIFQRDGWKPEPDGFDLRREPAIQSALRQLQRASDARDLQKAGSGIRRDLQLPYIQHRSLGARPVGSRDDRR